ncbi:MAG TPA: LuxR C-terminal-related transcriptional regulator [Thermoanaerobaculia bacterium]|nr:LuxR C-terminal-related transcriptional regulator [Thermoanaerobaculia bacterium]
MSLHPESAPRRAQAPDARGVRFVETKLRPPMVRDDVIHRGRLLDLVHFAVTRYPLALISAPAGYGKTTLLASLRRNSPDLDVAWLSLDEDDNDPNLFAAALLSALRRVDPILGRDAHELLPSVPGIGRAVLDILINDVIEHHPARLVLVLDDFHRVTESSIPRAIEYLIERMPPQMHLAIATRHDPQLPLPRLRVRRQVAEIRLEDLRFSELESAQLLNDVLRLNLSSEQIAILHNRTEGWPAGLSLLVGALTRLPAAVDREQFLGHLAHLDGYVFDFIVGEVFETVSVERQQFLLDVSVLAELTPDLCAAVTGRADAGAVLQSLYALNLFVVALDQPPSVFRFHELFRDFLRKKLGREQPEHLRELHRRAGEAERVFSRAITHLIAAVSWDVAARLIEEHGEATLREGGQASLASWIDALPSEVVAEHPRLHYLLGLAAWTRFDLGGTLEHLRVAVNGFETSGDRVSLGPALVTLSSAHASVGDFEKAAELTAVASEIDLPMGSRLALLVQETWFDMAAGENDRALEAFDAALDMLEAVDDEELLHTLAHGIHCQLFGLPGATARIERFARLAAPHMRNAVSPLKATTLTVLAWAQQWRGRSDLAVNTATEALNIAERLGGVLSVRTEAGLLLGELFALRGDHRSADATLSQLFDELRQPQARPFADAWLAGYLSALFRVRLLQGRVDEARSLEQRIRVVEHVREWPVAPVARALCRGLILAADGQDAEAEEALRSAMATPVRIDYFAGSPRVALAALLLRTRRAAEALEVFAPLLEEHQLGGTPGALLFEGRVAVPLLQLAREQNVRAEFAAQVLGLLGETVVEVPEAVVTPSGEPLTARELEVLRLISHGASNAAIAEKLVISVHTVKRHVANLLQKLGASSRAEAGAVARRLRIE